MFLPVAQQPDNEMTLVIRSHLAQAETAAALNRMLTSIDPRLVFSIRSWPAALSLVLFPARIAAAALGVMGLLAAMLAITGIFGMAAYSVRKRMRDLGIRVALGAHRTQLMRSALGRPLVLLASGSSVGLLLGMLTSRLLAQNRLPGHLARSSGACHSDRRHDADRAAGHMDSRATRPHHQSGAATARRVSRNGP